MRVTPREKRSPHPTRVAIRKIFRKYASDSAQIRDKPRACGEPRLQPGLLASLAVGEHGIRDGGEIHSKGKTMMFLLRAAFWLGIVLVLLPSVVSKPEPQTSAGAAVSAAEAASAASATVSDMRQFCLRQPDACAVGAQIAVALGQKAQAGAKMIYDFVTEKLATPESGANGLAERSPASRSVTAPQNTLVPTDVAPDWRSPRKDHGRNPV